MSVYDDKKRDGVDLPEDTRAELDGIIDKAVSRKPKTFEYDADSDPLYQQYSEKYRRQAKDAMEGAYANLTARSGGFGNSYAAVASQQAYNQEMDAMDDIIPELYQYAYDRFNTERAYEDSRADAEWQKNLQEQQLAMTKQEFDWKVEDREDTKYNDVLATATQMFADDGDVSDVVAYIERHYSDVDTVKALRQEAWKAAEKQKGETKDTKVQDAYLSAIQSGMETLSPADAEQMFKLNYDLTEEEAAEAAEMLNQYYLIMWRNGAYDVEEETEKWTAQNVASLDAEEITTKLGDYKENNDNDGLESFIGRLLLYGQSNARQAANDYVKYATNTKGKEWNDRLEAFLDTLVEDYGMSQSEAVEYYEKHHDEEAEKTEAYRKQFDQFVRNSWDPSLLPQRLINIPEV